MVKKTKGKGKKKAADDAAPSSAMAERVHSQRARAPRIRYEDEVQQKLAWEAFSKQQAKAFDAAAGAKSKRGRKAGSGASKKGKKTVSKYTSESEQETSSGESDASAVVAQPVRASSAAAKKKATQAKPKDGPVMIEGAIVLYHVMRSVCLCFAMCASHTQS